MTSLSFRRLMTPHGNTTALTLGTLSVVLNIVVRRVATLTRLMTFSVPVLSSVLTVLLGVRTAPRLLRSGPRNRNSLTRLACRPPRSAVTLVLTLVPASVWYPAVRTKLLCSLVLLSDRLTYVLSIAQVWVALTQPTFVPRVVTSSLSALGRLTCRTGTLLNLRWETRKFAALKPMHRTAPILHTVSCPSYGLT